MFDEAIGKYEVESKKLNPMTPDKKKGVFGLISNVAQATREVLSSHFRIHFKQIPRERQKELNAVHTNVEGAFLFCIDLDRLGPEDASIFVTDQWVSLYSRSGLVLGTNLTLRVHWSWLKEVALVGENLEFFLHAHVKAPSLKIPFQPFFDNRLDQALLLLQFVNQSLNLQPKPGPEHSYNLLQQLRKIHSGDEDGVKLIKEAEVGVDWMFGPKNSKNVLSDVRTLLESDLIIEKCRIASPSIELYHDILTTIRFLELEQNRVQNYADRHRIESNLDTLKSRIAEVIKGLGVKNRKMIFVDDKIPEATPSSFLGVREDWMSEILFPPAHPRSQELYITHPLHENRYLPLHEVDAILNEEKRHEFFTLVRALGAKSIKYRDLTSKSREASETKANQVTNKTAVGPTGIDVEVANTSGVGNSQTSSQKSTNARDLYVENSYEPTTAPHIPEGLKWFELELDWQRLAADRIEGGLKSTKLIVKTSRSDLFSSTEEQTVQTELAAVYSGLKVSNLTAFSQKGESSHKAQSEKAIEIIIDFE